MPSKPIERAFLPKSQSFEKARTKSKCGFEKHVQINSSRTAQRSQAPIKHGYQLQAKITAATFVMKKPDDANRNAFETANGFDKKAKGSKLNGNQHEKEH